MPQVTMPWHNKIAKLEHQTTQGAQFNDQSNQHQLETPMSNSQTNLDLISPSQASKEVTANCLFDAASPAMIYGRRAATCAGLTWGYLGGMVLIGGEPTSIANGIVTLEASTTNYLEANPATGAVSVNSTEFTTGYTQLYEIVAGAATVTSYTDKRTLAGTSGDPAGTAADLMDAHEAAANPHPTYLTQAEADELYAALAGGASAGRHAIPIMASSMRPSVSGGCAILTAIASAANQPDITTLDFDTTSPEFAQFAVPMPKSWNEGTVTFKPIWSHAATTTNFGVVWQLQAVAISDSDGIAASYGTAQTSSDTGGTTNNAYIGPESSAITVAGSPAAEDIVFFRIARAPSDGSDTMAIDARLHGIILFITTDAETDA